MQRILVVHADNQPGVLDRVAATFRRKGLPIQSLCLGPTLDPAVSRITIQADLGDKAAHTAIGFLERLANIRSVTDLAGGVHVTREVALIQVAITGRTRAGLLKLAAFHQAEVLAASSASVILMACGSTATLEAFLQVLAPFGILDLTRTGVTLGHPSAAPACERAKPFQAAASL